MQSLSLTIHTYVKKKICNTKTNIHLFPLLAFVTKKKTIACVNGMYCNRKLAKVSIVIDAV